MIASTEQLRTVAASLRQDMTTFLCDMIRYPSVRGQEGPVNNYIHKSLGSFCTDALLMPIPESFKDDPLYCWPMPGLSYEGTSNLRLGIRGTSPDLTRSLLFNAHSDVVPASKNQERPFDPYVQDGIVFGRGACDDKGQIAVLYLLIRMMNALQVRPKGNLWFDIVIEEENGGNGTLFMVRNPVKVDGAIVLEASEHKVYAAVRGAVWFELICYGKPGHSGRASDVVSALKEAVKAMNVLEQYHASLLELSRGKNPLFDAFENPMPVTFGMMNAGDWPATAPATASVKGVFGFLPNSSVREVQAGMMNAIRNSPHEWLKEHFELKFEMLNNEGNEIPPTHPLVEEMRQAMILVGEQVEVSAMTAACDAWRYNNMLKIPTIVFGAGSLKYAHSNQEQIALTEIESTAVALLRFVERWCGFETTGGNR